MEPIPIGGVVSSLFLAMVIRDILNKNNKSATYKDGMTIYSGSSSNVLSPKPH